MSRDSRAARRAEAAAMMRAVIPPADVSEVLAALRPAILRIRRGEWRLQVAGAESSRDSDLAVMVPVRFLELCDLLDRHG